MIYSMTGYGKTENNIAEKKITVEIKSVNSKNFDCSLRTLSDFKKKDAEVRSILSKRLIRGKIDLKISYTNLETEQNHHINTKLVKKYYSDLQKISEELGSNYNKENLLSIVMAMPDVLKTEESNITEEDEQNYIKLIEECIAEFVDFRKEEGKSLEKDIVSNIHTIEKLLTEIPAFEENRITSIKNRIKTNLEKLDNQPDIDENRFHQEIIYYIEKLDISEEKVRLDAHCKHFIKTVVNNDIAKGKKLGFISQEIGREINTLGSKANDFEIQKIVVKMKDALEKIKEQILNIL